MSENKKISIYDISAIGLFAAFVFVATMIRIQIPSPIDKTGIHFGNIFCILAGLLLGPKRGGLSAGLGSMFYDLIDPVFFTSAPFTLVFKAMIAFVAGTIAYSRGRKAEGFKFNLIGAISGSVTYVILYVSKGVIEGLFFLRNAPQTVMIDASIKLGVSLINAVLAVAVSMVLYPVFKTVMQKSGISKKLT